MDWLTRKFKHPYLLLHLCFHSFPSHTILHFFNVYTKAFKSVVRRMIYFRSNYANEIFPFGIFFFFNHLGWFSVDCRPISMLYTIYGNNELIPYPYPISHTDTIVLHIAWSNDVICIDSHFIVNWLVHDSHACSPLLLLLVFSPTNAQKQIEMSRQ